MNIHDYSLDLAHRAKAASLRMTSVSGAQKNAWLACTAQRIEEKSGFILAENEKDIAAAPTFGLTSAETDRLLLNPNRLGDIVAALQEIAMFPDPIGSIIESTIRPNGIEVQKV